MGNAQWMLQGTAHYKLRHFSVSRLSYGDNFIPNNHKLFKNDPSIVEECRFLQTRYDMGPVNQALRKEGYRHSSEERFSKVENCINKELKVFMRTRTVHAEFFKWLACFRTAPSMR